MWHKTDLAGLIPFKVSDVFGKELAMESIVLGRLVLCVLCF